MLLPVPSAPFRWTRITAEIAAYLASRPAAASPQELLAAIRSRWPYVDAGELAAACNALGSVRRMEGRRERRAEAAAQ